MATDDDEAKLAAAKAEWAEVDRRQQQQHQQGTSVDEALQQQQLVVTDSAEAFAHLRKLVHTQKQNTTATTSSSAAVQQPQRRRTKSPLRFCCCCCGGAGAAEVALEAGLTAEFDDMFSIAHLPMRPAHDGPSEQSDTSMQATAAAGNEGILRGVLCGMAGREAAERGNADWEAIGFQGADPATDLRGVGMFGALQMLHLATRHQALARALLAVSNAENNASQRFPLAATLLNVSRFVLEAARDGRLTRLFNARGGVVAPAHDLYCAAAFELHSIWARGDKTILDMGPLLKQLQARIANAPDKLLAAFAAAAASSDLARR